MQDNDVFYFLEEVEPNIWQSVFPSYEAENSQLHNNIEDGITYIWQVKPWRPRITIVPHD